MTKPIKPDDEPVDHDKASGTLEEELDEQEAEQALYIEGELRRLERVPPPRRSRWQR